MKLTEEEKQIIILLSNDIKVKDIGVFLNKSTSSVEKIISRIKEDNNINTLHGLVGEYLNNLYFNIDVLVGSN